MLRRVKRVTDTLNRQGLRVVAVATKYLPAREGITSVLMNPI
jgi:Mg2+-importing ATPase